MTPEIPASRFGFKTMQTPLGRLVLIGVLLLVLLFPAGMIRGVVAEREHRRDDAVADIVAKWGGRQSLAGPILRLPYVIHNRVKNAKGEDVETNAQGVGYFLPKALKIDATLKTELRHRGLFEVPVYVVALTLHGHFERPDLNAWGVRADDIEWQRAELLIGLSEPSTLRADAALTWAGQPLRLKPSTGQNGAWQSPGIHAALGQDLPAAIAATGADFDLKLTLNGAESLYFAPTAEETQVNLISDWRHPSFQGGWLPTQHVEAAQRATAQWSVSYLGRNYPQRWRESEAIEKALTQSLFGLNLATPIDLYALADRVTKYAVLTLVFTFAVIWLTEILSGQRVHPIQYGFVGAALCLFGLLQLSFAEHFGFTVAFTVAAAAVVTMVTLYSYGVLKKRGRALAVGTVLGGLYSYLYTILQAEDYALLGGSLALFFGIAVAMYLTRRVDWYAQTAG
jgi:inner membrane protein